MNTINPIIGLPKGPQENPLKVPQYVLDARQKITKKQFLSFVSKDFRQFPEKKKEVVKMRNMGTLRRCAEEDLKELIATAKYESEKGGNMDKITALYSLIELKKQEYGVICNYITKNR